MTDSWNDYTAQREYLVNVELYISHIASSTLRKPAVIRKKPEKRESSTALLDDNRLKDRASWQVLPKALSNTGQWRNATCKLSEEKERCFLNIYVDESILFQTVNVHLLNQSDIKTTDPSLLFRKDCIGLYCIDGGQRWTSASTAEPIYLQFPNTDTCSTWLALLRSYAVPEIYGRWFFPVDGGSYRMWRQVELTIVQARNMKTAQRGETYDASDTTGNSEFEGDISCEIHLNGLLCARTTSKKHDSVWQEKFVFSDLPPFESLDINIWREKKALKPARIGFVQILLQHFRRGETTEGWFPIIQGVCGLSREIQCGELGIKLRVDEEIILPSSAYQPLTQTFISRNFLDWMADLETKLKLKNVSNQLLSVAIANNVLIDHIQEYAAREVLNTPIAHQTLFRGNTVLTKAMELAMLWYGKAFLEASIGSVLRRLCAEKVAIEIDPVKSGQSPREVAKNVDQLILWCKEFWTQIYKVRNECPTELQRIFQTIRSLVEDRMRLAGGTTEVNYDLPKQSVSAFVFLRFIVPAILHPHLFGLCPGLPPDPVKRSLTLIGKALQSLANLNANVQKEQFMNGMRDFLSSSLPDMVKYIAAVSAPTDERPPNNNSRRSRSRIANDIRDRSSEMPTLDREAIPQLPYLIDVPRSLAVVTSAVIRSCRDPAIQPTLIDAKNAQLDEFCIRCTEIEELALFRVTQLAAKLSARRPSLPTPNSLDGSSPALPSTDHHVQAPRSRRSSKAQQNRTPRPSTAPSSGSNTPRQAWGDAPSPGWPAAPVPASPVSNTQDRSFADTKRERTPSVSGPPARPQHHKLPSSESVPMYTTSTTTTVTIGYPPSNPSPLSRTANTFDLPEESSKKKRGLFRGILKRQ